MNAAHAAKVAEIEAFMYAYHEAEHKPMERGFRQASTRTSPLDALEVVKRYLPEEDRRFLGMRKDHIAHWPTMSTELRIRALRAAVDDMTIPF